MSEIGEIFEGPQFGMSMGARDGIVPLQRFRKAGEESVL